MRHIEKGNEPEQLAQWKIKRKVREDWQPEWKRLKKKVKDTVMDSLLAEQGEICCYCYRDVSFSDRHVEHFRPQEKFKVQRFDYQNMLVSCQADKNPGEPWHCGYAKGDWFEEEMLISPLDKGCEHHFRYTAAGCVYPAEDSDVPVRVTIDILDLNTDRLRAMRMEAIDGALKDIETLSSDEIHGLISGYQRRNNDGRFTPFCMAIVHVLSSII
ncbi:MAG: TIGR02646 family protein [Deltaproteobacteria bacterium]|nr:MAG: TIGR02646 family protein [Deltaproteobacteria bacterium]